MRLNKNKGFTLVELLVVIAIIGLLASVVVVSLNSARAKARDSARVSDMKNVQSAIELYKDANGGNAPAQATYQTDLAQYLPTFPVDPKTKVAYPYTNTGDDDTYAMEFVTEQDGSVGPAGVYCSTSANIFAAVGSACAAADEK